MLEVNNLFHATRIIEGYGVIETTGQECANLGFGKVLVITDPFLASSEHYKKLKKSLDDAKIENFLLTNVKPNPRAEDCDEMAEFAKKNHVDALIALGGGSAMDQAKAVGAVVTNGKSTVEWGDTELDKYTSADLHSVYFGNRSRSDMVCRYNRYRKTVQNDSRRSCSYDSCLSDL